MKTYPRMPKRIFQVLKQSCSLCISRIMLRLLPCTQSLFHVFINLSKGYRLYHELSMIYHIHKCQTLLKTKKLPPNIQQNK